MANGVSTNNLDAANIIDAIIGNYEGKSVQLPIERLIEQVKAQIGPTYETITELNADLNWNAGAVGGVFGEATEILNGIYKKDGQFGSGDWVKIGEFPTLSPSRALIKTLIGGEATERQAADVVIMQALAASGKLYADMAAGLAATSGGDIFLTPGESGVNMYTNDGGVAVLVSAFGVESALQAVIAAHEVVAMMGDYLPTYFTDAAAFKASATVWASGTRINTKTGEVYDITDAGTGDFDHPISGVGIIEVKGTVENFLAADKLAESGVYGGVACGVDSLTSGAGGSSYLTYLRRGLRAAHGKPCGPGYFKPSVGAPETAGYYKTSGWVENSLSNINFGAVSFDGGGIYFLGGTGSTSDYFSISTTTGWRYLRVLFAKGPEAVSFKIALNGEDNTFAKTVDCYSATTEVGYYDIDMGSVAGVGLKIFAPVGDIFIQGFRALVAPDDVYVANIAAGGRFLNDYASQASVLQQAWMQAIGFGAFILDGGMNDRETITPAQHKIDLEKVIGDWRTALPDAAIFVVQSNEPTDASSTYFNDYVPIKISVAKEQSCGYIDMRETFGDYDAAVRRGLMEDGIHPNDVANRIRDDIYLNHIAPHIIGQDGSDSLSGNVEMVRDLERKYFNATADTTTVLYNIGLDNGAPNAFLEFDIRARGAAGNYKRSLATMRIGGNTTKGGAGSVSAVADVFDIFSQAAGNGSTTTFVLSGAIVDGRAQITITPTGENVQFHIDAKVTRVNGSNTGPFVYLGA